MTGKSIYRNAGMAIGQACVTGLTLFFLYRFLLRTIGIEQMGVWSIVLSTAMAAKISELGFSAGTVKFVAKHLVHEDSEQISRIMGTATISVAVVIGIVSIGAYFVLKKILVIIISNDQISIAIAILPYALLSLWVNAIAGVFLAGLDGCQRIDLRCWLMIGGSVLYLLASYFMVPEKGLMGLAYAQVLQAAIMLVAGWPLLRSQMPFLSKLPYRWNRQTFTEMFNYGVYFQMNVFMAMLYDPVTKALLSKFGGLAMTGYYEMANRMIMQFRALIVSANQVLVPVIATEAEKSVNNVNAIYRKNYQILVYLLLPLGLVIPVLVPYISHIWIGHYEPDFMLFSMLLLAGWLGNTIAGPAYFVYLGIGQLKWTTLSHAVIGVLNAIMGWGGGVIFGGEGVVWAWAIALIIGSSVIVIAYHCEHKLSLVELFPKEDRNLAIGCCSGGGAGVLIYYTLYFRMPISIVFILSLVVFVMFILLPVCKHPMTLIWKNKMRSITLSSTSKNCEKTISKRTHH